jgi:hypothetical protein
MVYAFKKYISFLGVMRIIRLVPILLEANMMYVCQFRSRLVIIINWPYLVSTTIYRNTNIYLVIITIFKRLQIYIRAIL